MDEGILEELHSEALPKGMRIWNALHGGYSWTIAYEPGSPWWSDNELAMWVGYTVTYCRVGDPSRQKIPVKGGRFGTFADAEAACKAKWRSIRSAQ